MNEIDPDVPLVQRIGRGDNAAVRLLVAAKLPTVLSLATRILSDRGEAEDVAQEAFERVWKHAPRWRDGAARFDTWLHTVVLNLCRDRLRRRRTVTVEAPPETADPAPGADSMLADAQRQRMVAAAVGALPERQREAILLVHYQDLSNIEAAKALEVSVDALESLLARGRRSLRNALIEKDEVDERD